MFTARILLILHPPLTAADAAETIARACRTALRPSELRFALPHTMAGCLDGLPEGIEPLFYDAAQGLAGVMPCLTEETHFLSITGPHAFSQRWDNALYALWRRQSRQTLFTASVPPCACMDAKPIAQGAATIRVPVIDGNRLAALRKVTPALQKRISGGKDAPHGILPQLRSPKAPAAAAAQTHLPALKEVLEDGSVAIGRGLALVCATGPVKTLVIDPSLLFGPVTFLMEGEQLDAEMLSLTAYLTGFSVYALHEAFVWPVKAQPQRLLRLPPPETLPGTTLARFEQLLGFHTGQRLCAPKAAMGLFGHEDTYPQRMPGRLVLSHKARSARMKLLETPMPLMVSAFIDLPHPRVAPAYYLLRFGFLRHIRSLPLVLYTGGGQERALRAAFPHTQSYPQNHLLPKSLLQSLTPEEAFARSKTLLMERAARRQVEFTHAAWVDMDILPHPVCEDAVPDLRPLMDDRIHLATVNGIPDPSFVVAPVELLAPLARLAQSMTQLDAELKRGLSETLLWERIFHKKPQWFAIHPMPRRRLLFLSAFDPQLLSHSVRPLISDLPKPYYAAQTDASKSKPEKESSLHG